VISDPEIVHAIDRYFASGGVIHYIPFGVSGFADAMMVADARHYAYLGWLRRYGERQLPADALVYLRAGLVTIVQARAPVVWSTVAVLGRRDADTARIAQTISATESSVRRTLELLSCRGHVRRVRVQGRVRYEAVGESPPDWREFMERAPQFAA
jgi:hypothetical protein